MEWKIGATQWSLPGEIPDAVELAGKLGLSCLQFDLGSSKDGYGLTDEGLQKKLTEDAKRYGVEIVSVVLNDLCGCGFVHPADDPKSKIAYRTLALGIETAAKMGVSSICMPSFFDNRIADEATYARTVEAVQYVCRLGREQGVTVYTENVLDAPALLQFFRDVGDDQLRLLFDSQNYMQMAGLAAAPVYLAAQDRVGDFLHVKDGIERLGHLPLGTGNSDFAGTLRTIVKSGFRGHFILENHYDTAEAVTAEMNVLRGMLDQLKMES